ncbi:hypothetical protein ABZO31_29905 [Streptomyces sp. HUAS MG47]|uniref:4'-phosphopantetheinyl transferase family protein n=1 Tax=Streptomyces solicamelliae TaxID=3231716 RepID=UPI00387825D6
MTAWPGHPRVPDLPLPPRGYRPPRGHTDVWTLHTSPATVQAARRLHNTLDVPERRRVEAAPSQEAGNAYLVGRVALRLVLGACLDVRPRSVPLLRAPCPLCQGRHGRPVVGVTADLHFSVSRRRNTVVLALAATPVGIDLGTPDRITPDVAGRLHPAERAAVRRLPEDLREQALLHCLVRKGAYLKSVGTGSGVPPSTVDIGPGPDFGGADPQPAPYALTTLAAPPGYAAATALLLPSARGARTRPTVDRYGCDACGTAAARPGTESPADAAVAALTP